MCTLRSTRARQLAHFGLPQPVLKTLIVDAQILGSRPTLPNPNPKPNSCVQEVRKGAGRGRGPASEWTHKELKDLVDWLVGLGPGRTEELKHSVRPLPACPFTAFRTYTHSQPAASPYITLPIPTRLARLCSVTHACLTRGTD